METTQLCCRSRFSFERIHLGRISLPIKCQKNAPKRKQVTKNNIFLSNKPIIHVCKVQNVETVKHMLFQGLIIHILRTTTEHSKFGTGLPLHESEYCQLVNKMKREHCTCMPKNMKILQARID
jgi:hypothetical protein